MLLWMVYTLVQSPDLAAPANLSPSLRARVAYVVAIVSSDCPLDLELAI